MKKHMKLGALVLLLGSTRLYAYHPAAEIVDAEIYEQIGSMVADTPHASLIFEEMGGGMTEASITTGSFSELEDLIVRDDLFEYVELLDGVVDVSVTFNDDSSVTLTVNQVR